ncbi:MAG TPA: hypothetical protein VGG90_05325 [Candidatus Dormibacteraeota bacterium]
MNAEAVRIPRARLCVVVAAAVVCAALLWLARTYTFYFDEWSFILTAPDWTWKTFFEPHNEHPSILLRAVYVAMLSTAGLRTYVPYMAVLLALHLTNVVLLFEVVRRRAGDLIGIAAAAVLLVLGAGWEDILWAFQIGWLASSALGLAMLLALMGAPSRGRLMLAASLLTASLMFSGIGLVFGVMAGVFLALSPGRRRDMAWFVPTAVLLAAWYVAFGRFGTHPNPQPTAANVLLVPLYAVWGLSQSSAALIGETGWVGAPLLVAAVAVLAWTWSRRRPDAMAVSVAAGLVAFYVITGLTRAQLGYEQAGAPRYSYIGAIPWLILLGDAARGLPWRGTWRPAIVAGVFLICFNSGVLLISYAAARTVLTERQVADLQALASVRGDPCLKPAGSVDLLVMPVETDPALYYRAIDRFGDPTADLPVTDHADYERGRSNLLSGGCS